MRPHNIFKTGLFAALAAAAFVTTPLDIASAQKYVAATCPQGYALDDNRCVRSGPAQTTKSESDSQWAFITRKAFGISSAKELDGANFCATTGTTSTDDANEFFEKNDLTATHVEAKDDRAAIETYQKYDCDVLVVANRVAGSTADSLEPVGDHIVLPEKFGTAPAPAPKPAAAPVQPKAPAKVNAPAPKQAPATVKTQPKPKPKPQKVATKRRCSAVRYGYTSGNTCACAGGRVFNGNSCVRRRWY